MIDLYKYTEKQKDELIGSLVILVDTREKENKHILSYFDRKKIKYVNKKLDFGDYSFYIPSNNQLSISRDLFFDKRISIERKNSLEELSGNLSQDRDRFEKELSLYGGKMHLLIENANYHDICESNYKTKYNNKSYIGSLHSFSYRYNFPFIFMPNEEYSGVYIYGTFYYFLKNILN